MLRLNALKIDLKSSIFLLILVFFAINLNAQSLRLKIENESKSAIAGASISSGNKIIGTTNKSGEVSISSNDIQDRTIAISAPQYQPLSYVFSNLQEKNVISIVLTSENELHEVVVTAGRKQENIATVPSSITIMSQKEIQVQSSINTNLSSILGNVIPGLGTTTNKATNSGQTLRGRQVLVLIDGIPQSTPLMNGARDLRVVDANAIERIEVIKGATSIYGNGSGGGIINYITKKSPLVDSFSGTTTVGATFNPIHSKETFGYRVSQFFNGRKNRFSYVIGGAFDYTGLQRDSEGRPLGQTDGLSNSSQSNAFVKLAYDIDEHTNFNVVYNFYSSTQNAKYVSQAGVYGQTPTIGVRGTEPGKNAGTPFNHNFMFTFSKNNLFNNTQLDISAYLNSFQSMNRYVASGTAWYGPGQTMINSNKNGTRINLNTPFKIGSVASEITYGMDILNDVTFQDLVDGRVYIPKMDMLNIAPYAQLKVDVLENLIFKGGVRYENATVRVDDYNTIASGPGNQGSIFVEGGKIPYNATMFNAGLRFNKYEIFNPFVSFSQAFAINELGRILRSAEESTIASLETDPIITNNYEAGFSSKFYNFNLTAAYYISTSKLGANLVEVDGRLVAQREPEKIKGYEITLDYRFSDKLNLGGSYSYVEGEAEFDDGRTVYLNGSRIAPPKATAYITYKPTSDWYLQLSWVNTGCRDRFEPNANGRYNNSEGPISTVNLLNFAGSYAFNKNWSLNLGVENLLNNSYYTPLSQYRAVNADYVMGNGMTTSLNLRYKF
ncbi:TonB-dependent receptor [Flavobacterium foetidum]|uniref:TonB-dependent receptor n=1 Tax=Flavobacterium foetidum TaxID=2026681 RepID=UPI001074AF30|nr:TonB-dependent receptor [Flavobacterium foetidum]KAF2510541.1 TonB-dependent receptor [Flavobacterium foetidum]